MHVSHCVTRALPWWRVARYDEHTRAQIESTALIRAAEEGHADCVRLLLDAGADKNAKDNVRASAGVRGVRGVWGC